MMGAGYISELGRGGTCVGLSKCMRVCVCLHAYRKHDAAQSTMKGRRCQGDSESECVKQRGGGRCGSCFPSRRVNP